MKKIILGIFILININIFSIEFNTYNMEKVHVYNTGRLDQGSYETLGTFFQENSGPISNGPTLGFFNDSLHIIDIHRGRTLKLDDNYNFEKIFKYAFYEAVIYKMDGALLGLNNYSDLTIIKNDIQIASISFDSINSIGNPKSIYYQQNTIFIHDKENKLWSIKNPGLDNKENRKNILNQDKTLDLIYNKKYKGLTIDSDKRLFLDGKLQTIDYETFITFWSLNNDKIAGKVLDGVFSYERLKPMMMNSFIGNDKWGNKYWASIRTILVFNSEGYLIDRFRFDIAKSSTTPTVSQEGDIFFLHNAEDAVTLYKIKRQW